MTKRSRKPPKPLLIDVDLSLKSGKLRKRDPKQPELPFDAVPPRGEEWSYELKWDGYRLAVHIEPTAVRLITRGGHDWTHRFPQIAAAAG